MEVPDDDARTVREAPLQLHSMVHGLRWDRDRNRSTKHAANIKRTDFEEF